MIRTTVSLDEEIYKEARKKAIDEGITFSRFINNALSFYLNKREADRFGEKTKK